MASEEPTPVAPEETLGPVLANIFHEEAGLIGRLRIGNPTRPLHFESIPAALANAPDRIRILGETLPRRLNQIIEKSQCIHDQDGNPHPLKLPITKEMLQHVQTIIRLIGQERVKVEWLLSKIRDRRLLKLDLPQPPNTTTT